MSAERGVWVPVKGKRVLAVLPDGHEIEGTYAESVDGTHTVLVAEDSLQLVIVRTVKPPPVTEPTTFGARVLDAHMMPWVCADPDSDLPWYCYCEAAPRRRAWANLPRPVRVVEATPKWVEP